MREYGVGKNEGLRAFLESAVAPSSASGASQEIYECSYQGNITTQRSRRVSRLDLPILDEMIESFAFSTWESRIHHESRMTRFQNKLIVDSPCLLDVRRGCTNFCWESRLKQLASHQDFFYMTSLPPM